MATSTSSTTVGSPAGGASEGMVPVGFSQGLQVAPADIERELKRLWKEGEGAVTRASLMNFAVYSESQDSLLTNSALMAEITKDHACRGILIAAQPADSDSDVTAWISAHCHVSGAGGRHVCCEQVAFLLKGKSTRWIPNIVFSHLDTDLPLYLWWQGNLPLSVDRQLWNWVNNLIFDSHDWQDKTVQYARLAEIQEKVSSNIVMSDLNWTRQVYLRLATAHFFDHPGAKAQLAGFESLRIVHRPDSLYSALLFSGWLAVQLGWKFDVAECSEKALVVLTGNRTIRIELETSEGPVISRIEGCVGGGERFEIEREKDADFLVATLHGSDDLALAQAMPAGRQDLASLVAEELRRGGKHRIYAKTVRILTPLIEKLGL